MTTIAPWLSRRPNARRIDLVDILAERVRLTGLLIAADSATLTREVAIDFAVAHQALLRVSAGLAGRSAKTTAKTAPKPEKSIQPAPKPARPGQDVKPARRKRALHTAKPRQ